MIPYLEQPIFSFGPVTIAAFGLIVSASVMVGFALARHRFQAMRLDTAFGEQIGWWVVFGGFVAAHLFSVLLYFPQKVADNPLVVFKLWEDISSFGGLVGGALALWYVLQRRGRGLPIRMRWAYVDVVALVFPVSLMVGRLACALAHDHPGTLTRFPLAVSLASEPARAFIARVYADADRLSELPPPMALATQGFHDLGWYEFLYLALVVVPVLWFHVRPRMTQPGTHPRMALVSFLVLYMPVRFLLDFLRVSDARYAGLTPAQWAALAAMALVPVLWRHTRAAQSELFDTAPPSEAPPA
jgi:phosphatidylglycerol:prolipoprotein diacylglycerol transferase